MEQSSKAQEKAAKPYPLNTSGNAAAAGRADARIKKA
jgi:hypothetical protein